MNQLSDVRDRRVYQRLRNDDLLRWKRPGRIEDHKAWSIDRSDSGIGFAALDREAPKVGEQIHLRIYDHDRWVPVEGSVRIARADPVPGGELVMVGCAIDDGPDVAQPPSAVNVAPAIECTPADRSSP